MYIYIIKPLKYNYLIYKLITVYLYLTTFKTNLNNKIDLSDTDVCVYLKMSSQTFVLSDLP
jgi:hypothetical protein